MIILAIVLSIGITNGGIVVWTLSEMLPFALPEFLGNLTMLNIVAIFAVYNAIAYSYQNIIYALSKTSYTKSEALMGLLPIVFFYLECFVMFGMTDWAWKHPAYAVLIVFPSYCLMTCRHIICSVTKMKFNWRQKNPLWFLLFVFNRYALSFMRKHLSFNYIAFLKGLQSTAT